MTFYKKITALAAIAMAGILSGSQAISYTEAKKNIEIVEEIEEIQTKLTLGEGFSANEQKVLDFFQKRGITDKYALAVLLGNIKQESLFVSNICEGGARVPYHSCHSGGYGLIQWTTHGRYSGLGRHARSIGGDPSHIDTQLSYLVTEVEWQKVENRFKTPGKSMDYYMNAAYYWLGWGIHGNRTHYSHQYLKALN